MEPPPEGAVDEFFGQGLCRADKRRRRVSDSRL